MRNLVHGIKEKTPMGFCDVPRKNLLDFLRDMKSISVPNKSRYKPLKKIHQAASEGDAERLQKMISLGKHSVHDRDFKQRTALHFACAYGKVEVVSVLLRNNCDIDAVDRNSITPLMKAVQNWTYGCVHTLLKHGADPNHMDKNGNTSLHYAVSEDNQTLVKYLLQYSADMEQKNKDGFTPLLLALKENKIEMAKFLVKKGANIHVFDEMKRNTLLYAIRWDSKDMVSILLKEGIDFFFKDVFGWTALRYAIEGTSKGSREILMDYDEKLHIKNKDGSLEYKNSEENSLTKNPSDPTSGFTLPKSNEDDDDFNDKLSSFKYAPAKSISNVHGPGGQRDKNEAKGTVEDSFKKYPTSKSVIEKTDALAYGESLANQEESMHTAGSDIFTHESLEDNVSDDSENIQLLNSECFLFGKNYERGQNNAERQNKAQVWRYPTLKSSSEGQVFIMNEVGKTAESHNFIIGREDEIKKVFLHKKSDLEIESLKETISDESEDNQSLRAALTETTVDHRCSSPESLYAEKTRKEIDDGNFSGTSDKRSQKDPSRQITGQVWMFSNLKSTRPPIEGKIFNTAGKMADSHCFITESDLEIQSLEETLSGDSEDKQPLYLPRIDDGHFNGASNERKENNVDGHMKEMDLQMKAEDNIENLDGNETTQSSDTMHDLQQCCDPHLPVQLTSRPMNILNEGQKVAELQKKSVKNQNNLESHKNTQLSDNIMDHQSKPIPNSSMELSSSFTYLLNEGEDESDLEMESEKKEKLIDDNESNQSSDSVKHLPPRRMHQFLKGLVPRCGNIISRQGKESHKIYCPKEDSTELKDNEGNTKFERKEIQICKSVVLEDDQDMCGDNKTKHPLDTMHNLQQCCDPHLPVQLTSRPMNLLNEGQKGAELQKKLVKNQNNLESHKNTQLSDNIMDHQSRPIPNSSVGLSPGFTNLLNEGEEEPHKIYCPLKDSTEIKDNDANTKFERREIQIFKSVVLEDDQDMCDDNKTKHPLVTANRKKHISSATEDAVHTSEGTPAVTTAANSVAAPDLPNAPSSAPATAVTKRFILQRKYVEARKPQPSVEETEKHDGDKKNKPKEKIKVLTSSKDTHDLNVLARTIESCSAEYPGYSLKSTPVFDLYKELVELKKTNVQILSEKTKLENELSEVKEEKSCLEKKLVRKKERNFILRSIVKEQVKKKRKTICVYNEIAEDLREEEEMTERREKYNRQVTETHEPEICLQTRDVELKQLQKGKEHVQKFEDHLYMLELENTSLMATVKNQKEEIEHLQRHLQDTPQGLESSPSLALAAAQKNKNIGKKHTSVITEMENTMKSLQSEVSSLKTSKESIKRELEKYKQYYLEELRNKNLLLYELNRINESREESHTEHHMKFEHSISASNSLNTRLVHKCSCVEKPHQLEKEDGQNLVELCSSSASTHDYMACSSWMSGNDMRELSEELSDLKQPMQLSLETQKKQKSDVGEPAGHITRKPFKKINQEHEIGERDSYEDFETCPSGMSTPGSLLQCSLKATAKPYSEFLGESDTTSTTNAMETEIRSLKSTLSKLKVSRALHLLELERYKSNKNLETSRTKLHMEMQHSRSAANAQSSRPFTQCSSAGYFDSIPGPRISLLPRENISALSSDSQLLTSGLEPCLGMMQQESLFNYRQRSK